MPLYVVTELMWKACSQKAGPGTVSQQSHTGICSCMVVIVSINNHWVSVTAIPFSSVYVLDFCVYGYHSNSQCRYDGRAENTDLSVAQ